MIDASCSNVVDMPQALFEGRLELQLPVGVAPLVEEAPGRLVARERTAPCAGGRSIASVVVIELRAVDPTMPIDFIRDELLDVLALPGGLKINTRELDDEARRMTSVIWVPAEPERGRPHPTRVLLGLRGGAGRLYVVMFESAAEQFEGLLPSFDASLDSLRISE